MNFTSAICKKKKNVSFKLTLLQEQKSGSASIGITTGKKKIVVAWHWGGKGFVAEKLSIKRDNIVCDAWRLPDDNLMTAKWLPDDCLMMVCFLMNTGGPLLTLFFETLEKWTNEGTYQSKLCFLENRVVREPCGQRTACTWWLNNNCQITV